MDNDAPVLAKIADFGLSAAMMQSAMGRKVDCPVWLAPEIMRNQEYTTKADVYSMGIILWELLTKQQKLFSEVRSQLTAVHVLSRTFRHQTLHSLTTYDRSLTTRLRVFALRSNRRSSS